LCAFTTRKNITQFNRWHNPWSLVPTTAAQKFPWLFLHHPEWRSARSISIIITCRSPWRPACFEDFTLDSGISEEVLRQLTSADFDFIGKRSCPTATLWRFETRWHWLHGRLIILIKRSFKLILDFRFFANRNNQQINNFLNLSSRFNSFIFERP